MKKLTLLLATVMLSSAAFAGGKGCCKGKKENCNKEAKAHKKDCKDKSASCCAKKGGETAKK